MKNQLNNYNTGSKKAGHCPAFFCHKEMLFRKNSIFDQIFYVLISLHSYI
jgi:hypothetical protein